jgi:hypothetical protein
MVSRIVAGSAPGRVAWDAEAMGVRPVMEKGGAIVPVLKVLNAWGERY